MNLTTLHSFLANITPQEHHEFILQELYRLEGERWKEGYMTCIRHNKKRKQIICKRRDGAIKQFLDYLSDLTHN